MIATLLVESDSELSEAPFWDPVSQSLYWLDCAQGIVHRLAWGERTPERRPLHAPAGCIAPTRSGRVLAAGEQGVVLMEFQSGAIETWLPPPPAGQNLFFNDGKCDAQGRFWVGLARRDLAPGAGFVLRIDPAGEAVRMLDGATLPNGMAWSADGRAFYLADSLHRTITAFEANETPLATRRVAIATPEPMGLPDGMAIDCDGKLWIADWGGGCVRRWDPGTGAVLATIPVPAAQASSCCFAGPDLRRLVITTAWEGLSAEERRAQPLAGSLFVARVETPGRPPDLFDR